MTEFMIYVVSIVVGLAVGLAAMFVVIKILSKSKSKWGVNLKRVYCPVCSAKQPIIRWPDSTSQMLWGGTTCPKCHAHLDKWGSVISVK